MQPKRLGHTALENAYKSLLLSSRNFVLASLDDGVADLAADLRAHHNLRTPDALQVAASLSAGCDGFITNDSGLRRVSELRILILDDLEL